MEVVPDDFMILFFCIDYTIWPGKLSTKIGNESDREMVERSRESVFLTFRHEKAGTTAESSSSRATRR